MQEIIGLDNKMCELIGNIKESLGIVEEQADKPIIEMANTEIAALAQVICVSVRNSIKCTVFLFLILRNQIDL